MDLHHEACDATKRAGAYAFRQVREDGHWYGEMKSNATITAEYVFLAQALGFSIESDRDDLVKYFLSKQDQEGSWSLAFDYPGDVSTTAEAYFALRLLGLDRNHKALRPARQFILAQGGIAKVRVFTRIFFACFGLFPWSAVPELPAELVLLPAAAPLSIYRLASWARATVIPMLVIRHHCPIYALPNGRSASNDYLDELWDDPSDKMVPYAPSAWSLWHEDLTAFAFTVIDRILKALGGLRWLPLRKIALRQCIAWILERQEPEGDIGGIFPPLHAALFALTLEGYGLESSPVRRGIEALQNTYAWRDGSGLRMQGCISPIWDTILMTIGLIDSGLPTASPYVTKSTQYLKARQQLGPEGDWRVYNQNVAPGGFSFEYFNSWYPDIDDTAAAILALVKQDPNLLDPNPILSAIQWILGLQNSDGGWAAFDRENNYLFLNKIPFSDMDSFCDPSTADVTGRVLECFGLFTKRAALSTKGNNPIPKEFIDRISSATERAINFIATEQEPNGSWYGRWGSNYIYGTSTVLCGLSYYHLENHDATYPAMKTTHKFDVHAALEWFLKVQNPDGGWGERLETYSDPTLAAHGPSTPSQTAWALMGLLAYLPPTNASITRGIQYLTQTQVKEGDLSGSWKEDHFTGTGFPNHFYLCYTLYSQYFPMMALGRYTNLSGHRPLEDLGNSRTCLGPTVPE
ncbi:squalene cyclase [Aspergillus sclerotioniger CBS 115572]|uniref:Terpene cyclase/mutase family member n=1 Tax=Aspergillus sclerotioniger CBS 115572 TaxID=1450535 RepID=A0A317WYN6_9EURO|nr:squalene cyclase [Aspergillus sclerotioniger CBS 115572]PWY90452.1 squalene cyclase [Aspergillus sclerotioniger CBS 115572]